MTRALYSMSLEGQVVVERRYGPGVGPSNFETLGSITEAAYFGAKPRTLWARLFGAAKDRFLAPPFDAEGADAHQLLRDGAPSLDGDDDPLNSIRLAYGRVTPLLPRLAGDEVVLRDAWSAPGARITSAVHFGLVIEGTTLPPVAVAFAQSPLVVAKPTLATLNDALVDVPSEALTALTRGWPGLDLSSPASLVELRVGDTVEVLGAVTTKEQCRGRFDLDGRTTSYRDAPSDLSLVLGDRQGLRMVLRKR